jgi:4-hydroxybenzoate polyprenyltransferase
MKNYIDTIKNVCAFCAFFSLMFGGCLADNENLLPTILFVALGGFFVFIYAKIQKAQEEENNKAN